VVTAMSCQATSPMQATLEARNELLQKLLAGRDQQGGPPRAPLLPASQQPATTASGGIGQMGTMVTGELLRDRDGNDGGHDSVSMVAAQEHASLTNAEKDGGKVNSWTSGECLACNPGSLMSWSRSARR
jgi:hypothetical protein